MKIIKRFLVTTLLILIQTISTSIVYAEDLEISLEDNLNKTVSITKYYKTYTIFDENNNPIDSVSYEVSEEEAKLKTSLNDNIVYSNFTPSASHQTASKKITLTVSPGGGASVKIVNIDIEWFTIPNVKLYDIVGFYLKSGTTQLNISSTGLTWAKQIYDGNTLTYDYNSGNKIKKSNGLAYVMNIVDSTKNDLKIKLQADFIGSDPVTIGASYQHATSTSITTTEARNFTFGSSANSGYQVLGGTFIFKDNIANKYDKMAGVQVTYDLTSI